MNCKLWFESKLARDETESSCIKSVRSFAMESRMKWLWNGWIRCMKLTLLCCWIKRMSKTVIIDQMQEVEHVRSQILEVKGNSFGPIVVVLNKTDLIASLASETTSKAEGDSSSPPQKDTDNFLCQEMVESLVTCDWDHGFVSASAKNNVNIVQVSLENYFYFDDSGKQTSKQTIR